MVMIAGAPSPLPPGSATHRNSARRFGNILAFGNTFDVESIDLLKLDNVIVFDFDTIITRSLISAASSVAYGSGEL